MSYKVHTIFFKGKFYFTESMQKIWKVERKKKQREKRKIKENEGVLETQANGLENIYKLFISF